MDMKNAKLVALKVERRAIGGAIFEGTHLDFTDIRQLSSNHRQADSSALGFVHWLVDTFEAETVALEIVPTPTETRRSVLTRMITESLRERGVSVLEVRKLEFLSTYGMPPPKTRREVRETVKGLWPILESETRNGLILDATALGLYVQTERLFIQ
ncbi:MAG: hypothetical protein P8Y94_16245 [Acidobacteriota bacterium]